MSEILQDVIDFIGSALGAVLDFLYNLIFIDGKNTILSIGTKMFKYFSENFLSQPFTLQSLYYIAGLCFFIFVVKQAIHIIRG